jgi:Uma2 family endonuclease
VGAVAVEPRPRAFTIEEYHALGRAGIIRPDERVERIAGQITAMAPVGPDHVWGVNRLNRLFARQDAVVVSPRNPICIPDRSEPEPDPALVRVDAPQDRTPLPEDVALVIELAASSLGYDRGTKAPLFGRAGVPELWIADLNGEQVHLYRDPSPDGYRTVRAYRRGEHIPLSVAPNGSVDTDLILGAPPTRQ